MGLTQEVLDGDAGINFRVSSLLIPIRTLNRPFCKFDELIYANVTTILDGKKQKKGTKTASIEGSMIVLAFFTFL